MKVAIYKMADRGNYAARWIDPVSGKRKQKSTGTRIKRDAERFAANLERDLIAGRDVGPQKTLWCDFKQRYEIEVFPKLSKASRVTCRTIFKAIDQHIEPRRLAELDFASLSKLASILRAKKRSEETVKGYLARIHSALNWAKQMGMIWQTPDTSSLSSAKRQKTMKGRPISGEEFERMIEAVEGIVGGRRANDWEFLLRGLWTSGLRLGEALNLSWDNAGCIYVCSAGRFPTFRIPAELEKARRERVTPMAPEFHELLMTVPETARTGPVFHPSQKHDTSKRLLRVDNVSPVIVRIGKRANVIVRRSPDGEKLKFASAHDLRRTFGERWAQRVMPQQLQELMRHENIDTTLRFYVGRNVESSSAAIWAAAGAATPSGRAETAVEV